MKNFALLAGILSSFSFFGAAIDSIASPYNGTADAPHAADSKDPYYQIVSVQTKITPSHSTQSSDEALAQAKENFSARLQEFGFREPSQTQPDAGPLDIAQLLLSVWKIIEENKPVVNVQSQNATALPNIAKDNWAALTGWRPERTITYHTSAQNGYGMTVVDLEYQVKLLFGGSYQGQGHYIASAQVLPVKVDVMWGFNLDMTATVPSVVNIGSESDPMASISMNVTYTLKSLFRNETSTESYLLQGNGLMKNQKSGKIYYSAFTPAVAPSVTVSTPRNPLPTPRSPYVD